MNMFEITAKNETVFQLLKLADAMSRECCAIKVTEERIVIPIVDGSNSAQAEIKLELDAFTSYNVEPQTFVVNLSTLVQVVDAGNDDGLVTMEKDEEQNVINLSVGDQDYKLSLISDVDYSYKPLDVDYDLTVILTDDHFKEAISAADVFSDEILFKYDSSSSMFVFKGKGDNDMTKRELYSDDLISISGGDSEATFGLPLLKSVGNVVPEDTEIKMKMAEGRPIEIDFEFEEGHGHSTYFLAPRLKD